MIDQDLKGRVTNGASITADREITCDVLVVGSGAGGAVLAAGLAEAGLEVLILEEGGYYTRRDFTLREPDALGTLYQDSGGRGTDDRAITVLQGRGVGGSTTINWTTCFRTPERVLANWRRVHRIEGLDAAALAPHFEAVEARLNVSTWPEEAANANNNALLEGAPALGWEAAPLRRNVRGCANSGYCGMGCPVGGKQAMHVTYLPDALAAGAGLIADCRVERLAVHGERVVSARASILDRATRRAAGPAVTVRPKVVAVCGGAINSPALLLRSGLNQSGRVGFRTFLHPVVLCVGIYPHRIEGFYGAPQSIGSHQFIDRGPDRVGFFLEAAPVHPMLSSTTATRFGVTQRDVMHQLAHSGALIALSVDGLLAGDVGGRVSLRDDGRIKIDYPVTPPLVESFRAAHEALARLELAAGAEAVITTHTHSVEVRSEADLARLAQAAYGAHEHAIFTAHQMGGCAMGPDRETSVGGAGPPHPHPPPHDVVGGGAGPPALGVNPSETVYGLAHRARRFVGEAV